MVIRFHRFTVEIAAKCNHKFYAVSSLELFTCETHFWLLAFHSTLIFKNSNATKIVNDCLLNSSPLIIHLLLNNDFFFHILSLSVAPLDFSGFIALLGAKVCFFYYWVKSKQKKKRISDQFTHKVPPKIHSGMNVWF